MDEISPTAAAADASPLAELLAAGGPVVAILLGISILSMALILLKLWQYGRLLGGRGEVEAALAQWRQGQGEAACARLGDSRKALARPVAVALAWRQAGRDPALAREEAARVALLELDGLRGHLRLLELVGALSPLLGLLGTVLGMITAFQALQNAGAQVDPALLSGGIWEALLTTAVGLIVGIPAVAAAQLFDRLVERQRIAMESALTQVFTAPAAVASPPETTDRAAWPARQATAPEAAALVHAS